MREKERVPRERNNEHPWRTVQRRRKPSNPHLAKHTCFVNHLPLHLNTQDIAKIFKTHGPIEFIYLPIIRPQSSHKCAFVQFKYPQSLPTAIRDENRRKVETKRITVHPAKYDKPPSLIHRITAHNLPPPPQNAHQPAPANAKRSNSAKRDWRSYKEVTNPSQTLSPRPIPNEANQRKKTGPMSTLSTTFSQ